MKYLIFLILLSCISCTTITKQELISDNSFKNEINKSIIDGFFDGDSTKAPKGTYFIK